MDVAETAVAVARAAAVIDRAEAVTVLTGAGISTDSGIPDFRGPDGIWTKNPAAERASDIRAYVADRHLRIANWAARASGSLWVDSEPNTGHRALVRLQDRHKLHTLITQNIDGLHQKAGIAPDKLVEIHGTTRRARCLSCDWTDDIEVVLARVRAGDDDPHCEICSGLVKSATISFGQALVADDLERSQVAAESCDVFLAVGSSLAVYPIAHTVPLAVQSGARLIIVNGEQTPFDRDADVVVRASISDVLGQIVG